jgi:DNA-binding NarL/FixJ family response regulator
MGAPSLFGGTMSVRPLQQSIAPPGPDAVRSSAGDGLPEVGPDVLRAERAWCEGEPLVAIDAVDRALASGGDVDGRAAAVAAAVAAADGALLDAARRWRVLARTLTGTRSALAAGRAGLTAALAGDVDAAARDLAAAHACVPEPAPRGLIVLLDGVEATIGAVRGEIDGAGRRLAGLATTAVPPDPLASDRWDDLAAVVIAAGGDARSAQAMLGRPDRPDRPWYGRHRLLAGWLDLRTGRLTAARAALTAVGGAPVLRRDAVLAAAVTAGLARRSGDERVIATTWHRVAPVIAGADIEILLLDAWGELATTAVTCSLADGDAIGEAMHATVTRAGSPWWAVASEAWWNLERAITAHGPAHGGERRVPGAAAVVADAARTLTSLASDHPGVAMRAEAASTWGAVLTGGASAPAVARAATRLAAAGHHQEAAALCSTAAARAIDPMSAKALLGQARRVCAQAGARRRTVGDELSDREREIGALVIDGLTHKQIGAKLYISPKTVEQHVARLRQKLDASNRAALVAALRRRLDD